MQGASEGGGGKDDIYMYFVAIRNGLLIFSVFGVKDVMHWRNSFKQSAVFCKD